MEKYVVIVNPKTINWALVDVGNLYDGKFVWEGDWDKNKGPLKQDSILNPQRMTYITIQQLFENNIPFYQSEQYLYMKKEIENGTTIYWCKNTKDIDEYFNRLRDAYENIKINGYKSQKDLIKESLKKVDPRTKGLSYADEIKIFVDRNGCLLLGNGGSHRLLIADLLNISEVPVIICGVHNNWAKICFKNEKDILSAVKNELNRKYKTVAQDRDKVLR